MYHLPPPYGQPQPRRAPRQTHRTNDGSAKPKLPAAADQQNATPTRRRAHLHPLSLPSSFLSLHGSHHPPAQHRQTSLFRGPCLPPPPHTHKHNRCLTFFSLPSEPSDMPSSDMSSSDSHSDSNMASRAAAAPAAPSLPWRFGSATIIAATGLLCRGFLRGLCTLEVRGQDRFLELLDQRRDVGGRERGLITVANHVSVLDDPLIWGSLPLRYMFTPDNLRWSLASHDLAFTNKVFSAFFNFGQTLPTHRLAHSPYGGLFQPTITQAIRLLSRGPFTSPSAAPPQTPSSSPVHPADIPDPFTSATLTYTTTGHDSFPAPSAYASRRHAWVHIFPEGKIHQKDDHTMRYFKWGVARLILESEPCPDIVPMWVQGPQYVMHESREFPRFLPRPGRTVSITFGERVGEDVFGDLRARWRELRERDQHARGGGELDVGVLSEGLKYGREAVELRKECTLRVREQVLRVRRSTGLPDEDPKVGLVETYAIEGGRREGRMEDDSWVRDT